MRYYSADADLLAEGDCSLFIVNCSFAKGDYSTQNKIKSFFLHKIILFFNFAAQSTFDYG